MGLWDEDDPHALEDVTDRSVRHIIVCSDSLTTGAAVLIRLLRCSGLGRAVRASGCEQLERVYAAIVFRGAGVSIAPGGLTTPTGNT